MKEYISEGIVLGSKQGKTMYYCRAEVINDFDTDILDYFLEAVPFYPFNVGGFLIYWIA